MANRLLVYAWHNIEGTWCFPNAPGRGVRQFRAQLELIGRLGTVVPLERALRDLADGRPLPPRAVALTFDDGYADSLELAAPVLAGLGLPATFFLVPAMLSGEVQAWWETLAWAVSRSRRSEIHWADQTVSLDGPQRRRGWFDEVAEQLKHTDRTVRQRTVEELVRALAPDGAPPNQLFMDWNGARDLVRRGFAVGSHSQYHAILAQETAAEQRQDLLESRRRLQHELQVPAEVLAYPNGRGCDFDEHTVAAARDAGHSFAVTTMDGHNTVDTAPYKIRRACIWPHHGRVGVAAATRHMLRAGAD